MIDHRIFRRDMQTAKIVITLAIVAIVFASCLDGGVIAQSTGLPKVSCVTYPTTAGDVKACLIPDGVMCYILDVPGDGDSVSCVR